MSLLTREDLSELGALSEAPAVSLYFPTHRAGPAIHQNAIRLKNLLAEARRQLSELSPTDIEALLAPAAALVADIEFWRHQADGLALFLAPDFFRRFRLPLEFDELALVSDRFHLKPLLPLLTGDGRFHVLALSQNRVRFFEGSRHGSREIDLGDDAPRRLTDAVGHDVEQRSLQFHTGTGAPSGGRRAAVFHGQGTGSDDEEREIEQFLHRVDSALSDVVDEPAPPLVLAATEPLLGAFRKLSGYPNLVSETVEGNHDDTPAEALHDHAWRLVEPLFQQQQHEERARWQELAGTGKTAERTEDIVLAAHDGRIDVLFVPLGRHRWGRFDAERREVELHDQWREGDQDLLDRAAVDTLKRGGTVYALPAEQLPDAMQGAAAAVQRY